MSEAQSQAQKDIDQESYADKIMKLLRKAESTTPEEAELLYAKAQELMTKYAIDEAMLNSKRGFSKDEIVTEEFVLSSGMRVAQGDITWQVVRNNGCRAVYTENSPRVVDGKMRKQTYILHVTGFKSDVDRVRALDASLQLQAMMSQTAWWKENKDLYNKREGFYARRQFIFSFASGMGQKLREATAAGRAAAEAEEARRSNTSQQEARDSVALVLRSREDLLDEFWASLYPHLRSSRRRQRGGGWEAHSAGHAAGRRADVGQPGVGGSRRQIGK